MRLGMVAGEASGDLLAALLMGGLKERWPALRAAGLGGPRMQAQGFEAWWPSERLAVHGYAEVLRVYRQLVAVRRQLGDRLLYRKGLTFEEAKAAIAGLRGQVEHGDADVELMLGFLAASTRGIVR